MDLLDQLGLLAQEEREEEMALKDLPVCVV